MKVERDTEQVSRSEALEKSLRDLMKASLIALNHWDCPENGEDWDYHMASKMSDLFWQYEECETLLCGKKADEVVKPAKVSPSKMKVVDRGS